MGGRTISPGGALLRSSRMFSIPKTLPEPQSQVLEVGDRKSPTMTRHYPRHQSITSPLSSREKGDWGYKRPFPLKSTMVSSTPVIRINQVDAVENVTDFASASDHTLSLEKFQELRVAITLPRNKDRMTQATRAEMHSKSVFEEEMDFTDFENGRGDDRRWKFQGPWLARLTEGEFISYLGKKVRPKRAQFRSLLKARLAEDMTTQQNNAAMENGQTAPPALEERDITDAQFTDYLRQLRNDRVTLYTLVSKFLDLAPLGQPAGFVQTLWTGRDAAVTESPWGKAGPPPSHPSAGLSYLRTAAFMDNHAVYGPQAKRAPALARVVYPRAGPASARLGVGGFVAATPGGDNGFNFRFGRGRTPNTRSMVKGVLHLDVETYGGAKAYVEAQTASVDPSGKVVLQLGEASPESQVIAREIKGQAEIYHDGESKREVLPEETRSQAAEDNRQRMNRVTDEILEEPSLGQSSRRGPETDVVSSSQSYGLGLNGEKR